MAEHTETLPDPLPADPLVVVSDWLVQAWAAHTQPNPNSMVLATSTREGRPSARVVLCKEIVPQPGYIVFYTNYLSAKGRQLKDNPHAAAVMHWDASPRPRPTATRISPRAPGRVASVRGRASRASRSARAPSCSRR